jgi:protein TonB
MSSAIRDALVAQWPAIKPSGRDRDGAGAVRADVYAERAGNGGLRYGVRSFGAPVAASMLLHALVLAFVAGVGTPRSMPAAAAIPIVLLVPGSGGGASGNPRPEPPAAAPVGEPPPAPPTARHGFPRKARPLAIAKRAPRDDAQGALSAAGKAPSGGGRVAGEGAGGGDRDGAYPAYAANPLPPYPLAARRQGREGVVVLDVLVGRDGHAAEVRVLNSSGHAPLDESATTTVRDHWRFSPARRDGEAVDSWVTVPIRFRLAAARR